MHLEGAHVTTEDHYPNEALKVVFERAGNSRS